MASQKASPAKPKDKPAAVILRDFQVWFYDAQDRVFRTQELFVNHASGAVGTNGGVAYVRPSTAIPTQSGASPRPPSATSTRPKLGERTGFRDRAGTTHAYADDVGGRQTADAITAVGTNVIVAVRRIESASDVLGRVTSVTSFDAPVGGTALDQVTRAYNGFGQLTFEWQSHTGLADTATTPRVLYAHKSCVRGDLNQAAFCRTPSVKIRA